MGDLVKLRGRIGVTGERPQRADCVEKLGPQFAGPKIEEKNPKIGKIHFEDNFFGHSVEQISNFGSYFDRRRSFSTVSAACVAG